MPDIQLLRSLLLGVTLLLSLSFMIPFVNAANKESVEISDGGRVVKKTIHLGGEKDEMGFTDEEKFQDLFELTEDDFEERVLESPDPWIILFHTGMIDKEWKTLAVALRGIVWFGTIHKMEQDNLVDELKYPIKTGPPARVYPWGSSRLKKKWTDVASAAEAKTLAIQSLPDSSLQFAVDDLHEFLFASYATVPSRLPVVFFAILWPTEAETLTPLFKSVALHYHKYFNFGFIPHPTREDLDTFQYRLSLPGMLVLIAKDFAATDPEDTRKTPDYDFNVISYCPDKQGPLTYMNILKFLFSINYQFRKTLPGMNHADDEDILQMEEELEIEKLRFNVKYIDQVKEVATLDPFNVMRSPGKKPEAKAKEAKRKTEKDQTKKSGKKKKGDRKEGRTKDEGEGKKKEGTSPEKYEEGKKFRKKKEEL